MAKESAHSTVMAEAWCGVERAVRQHRRLGLLVAAWGISVCVVAAGDVAVGGVAGGGTLGCRRVGSTLMPGASEEPWGFERQDRSEPSGVERWEYFGRVEELRLLGSFPSRGHGTGMWDAELRGNEAAQRGLAALLVGADEMPVGSLLVQGHTQRNVGMHQGWFVREKRGAGYYAEGGDWDYMVVGSDGRIEKRGKLEHCVRCHAEAEVDYVFTRVMP